MKKFLFIFSILYLGLLLGFSPDSNPYAYRIRPISSAAPLTCSENEIAYSMGLHKLYICKNTGYTEVGGGGGGGISNSALNTQVMISDGTNATGDADLTFVTDTLTATKIIGSTSITDSGLTATRVLFAGTAGILSNDADFTFATDTATITKIIASTSVTVGAGSAITSSGAGGAIATAAFVATGTSGGTIPLLNANNTWSGTQTMSAAKLIIGTNSGAPSIVANALYRDTGDNKLYIGNVAGNAYDEIFEAGVSLVNLTSNVTGTLPVANGGTGITSFGTGIATFLGTPSSANLASAITNETGTGVLVFGTSPDFTTGLTLGGVAIPTISSTSTFTNKTLDVEGTGNVITTVQKSWFPAAGCNNATASSFWDLGTSLAPTPTCKNSSSGAAQSASLDFPDSDGMFFGQSSQMLPSDFSGTVDAKIRWFAAATSGDVIWNVSTICVADAETDAPSFNTVSTVTDTAKGTTLQMNDASITSVTITGCAAGELMHLKISRDRTTSGDTITGVVSFQGLELTYRRTQ